MINSRHRVLPYYCPRKVSVAAPDGGTTDLYLAQGTNDSASFKPMLLPGWLMGNAIVPVRGNVTDIPAKFLPGAGAVYKTEDIVRKCPDVVACNPFKDTQTEHRIVVIPVSMPMLPCAEGGYRGGIDEAAHDVMDLNIPGTSAWLRFAQDFDLDFHLAVATAVQHKKSNLGKAWPSSLKKQHMVWADTLYVDPTAVGEDEAEELAADLTALEAHVASIRGPTTVPLNIDNEPRDDMSAVTGFTKQPDQAAGLSPNEPAPLTVKASTPFKIPKKPSLAIYDEHDVNYAKFCMVGAGFDPSDNSVTVGTVTEAMESVFSMPGGKNTKLASFYQVLINGVEELSSSTDFLMRRADPPNFDTATLALLFNNVIEPTPMTDLTAATTGKHRMRIIFFAPDNKQVTAQREAVTDDRVMEEICGEEKTNFSKVRTSILYNSQVLSMEVFLIWLGNVLTYLVTAYHVNVDKPDDVENPFLYRCYRDVGLCLTTKAARKFLKHLPSNVTIPKILAWWAQICDQIFILVTSPICQPRNVILLLEGKSDKIDVTKYREAAAVLSEAKTKWSRIITMVDSVPDSAIFANFDAAKKRKTDTTDPAKEAKKVRPAADTDKVATTKTEKAEKEKILKKGCIVYKASGAMPMVDEDDPKKRICAAHHRDGVMCSRKTCPMIHELDPTKWAPETLKKWSALIEATDSMSWHSSVDTAKVRSIVTKQV